MGVTNIGQIDTLYRGSNWRIRLPKTVTVNGTAQNYVSTGYLQLEYGSTPTVWKSSDGASRFDSSDSTYNYFLIPSTDDILDGTGDTTYAFSVYWVDGSGDKHLVGIDGVIPVSDV